MKTILLNVAVLSVFLFGCIHTNKSNSESQNTSPTFDRQVAQSINTGIDKEIEQSLSTLLNSTDKNEVSNFINSDMDRLFVLLVSSYSSIENFNKELDRMIEIKKKDPANFDMDPLQSDTYAKLMQVWMLKEKYEGKLVYFYKQALKTRADKNANPTLINNSRVVINTINTYLNSDELLKQVELQNLMREIQNTYRDFVFISNVEEVFPLGKGNVTKNISNIDSSLVFDKKIVSDAKKMNSLYTASQSESEKTKSKISEKFAKYAEEINNDLNQIAPPTFEKRSPSSIPHVPQDVIYSQGKKLYVSDGENGNIVGKIFPAGIWAFTFDDGPAPTTSGQMVDLFSNYSDRINPRGKATFFVTAEHAQRYPSAIARALQNGFPIENHSFDHANLSNQGHSGRVKQIITANNIIEGIAQKTEPTYKIQYYRCPYGACYAPKIPDVRGMLVDQKQIHVYWRIDSLDWKLLNGPKVADLVKKQMKLLDHGVILMHDTHATTVDAARIVLSWLKQQNNSGATRFKLVTIPEAVDLTNASAR